MEMFYLMMYSTHFLILLHGVGHMVKDSSDSKKGSLLPPLNGLLLPISSKGFLYAPSHRQNTKCCILCYINPEVLAGKNFSSMGPPCSINWTTH